MSKYYNLKVKEVVQETDEAFTIHFKQPLFTRIKYKAGQFLTLIIPVKGAKYRRAYSLSSAPNIDDPLSVTIKCIEQGLISNYLKSNLKAGDKVEVMEPMGNFFVETNRSARRHVVLIGAGSGITPLMSMAKSVLLFEPNSQVSLIYGNRSLNTVIFRKQLEEMQTKHKDRFKVVHVLSRPDNSWNGLKGRIDQVTTINILNLLPKSETENTEYYMCGPEGMMQEATKALQQLKVPADKIHHESFFALPAEAGRVEDKGSASTLSTQEVTIILDGEKYQVTVDPRSTILEAALDAGIDVPYSCQSGLCTACRGKCKSGTVKMDQDEGLSDSEKKEGYVLTCVSHPLSDDVVIEIG